MRTVRRSRRLACLLVSGLFIAQAVSVAGAQVPGKKGPVPSSKTVAPPKGPLPPQKAIPPTPRPVTPQSNTKGSKLPKPEDVSLETRDGVSIKATYYPGTAKKDAVPVIMIHGIEGQRGDYHSLAVYLQGQGHAAIVPDLRGHGQSKTQKRVDGTSVTLEAEKLTRPALEAMVFDVQACKKFLMEKNNAGELNIEQLCVIGAELGAIIAVRFAAADWSLQDLPAYKQGKDVKALVLLSPAASVKGVTLRDALAYPPVQSQLSIMLVAGARDSKATAEAKKLHNSLEVHHRTKGSEDDPKNQDLFFDQPDVALAGTKLLTQQEQQKIARFVELRLTNRKADFPWQERTNPLGN